MRVMLDTNIFISAALFPKGRAALALQKALNAHADLFLTGDKDFLESSVVDPRIIGVADFLDNME